MKVLHLVAGDLDKGAARGAIWLHKGLLKIGVESHLCYTGQSGQIEEKNTIKLSNIFSTFSRKVRLRLWRMFLKFFYPNGIDDAFSSGRGEFNIVKLINIYKPDIIHLHWINQFSFDYSSISKANVKVVWTLRDMWPFTGGCHYSLGCNSFVNKCGSCPKLGSKNKNDLSHYIYTSKAKNRPSNVHYVAISKWLGLQAKKSSLAGSNDLTVIENSVDTEQFYFEASEEIENFSKNKKVILFGGINLNAPYKGLQFIVNTIEKLDPEKYCIVSFGRLDISSIDRISHFDALHFGPVNNSKLIRQIYSSSDIYLFPSTYEAFGKTIVEALLCGTPVIVFNNSGPSEIVRHHRTGYIAKSFCTDDLVKGVEFLSNNFIISKEEQDHIRAKYSIENGASKYKELYSRL